jgi:replicative superfamily II helicase
MTKCLNNVVLATTKVAIQKVSFIFVNCDEITNMDNQSWISMHVDVVEDFKKTPIFVNFQHVTIGTQRKQSCHFYEEFCCRI